MPSSITTMLKRLWRPAPSAAEGVTVGLDDVLVFYDYVRVTGWAFKPGATLREVCLHRDTGLRVAGQVGLPKAGVQLGENLGFCVTLLDGQWKAHGNFLQLVFSDGTHHRVDCNDVADTMDEVSDILFPFKADEAMDEFKRMVKEPGIRSILEVGSRARSHVVRRDWFPHLAYTGIDILEGENVDIVGDAHQLSRLIPDKTFDAVFSMSTFEHLAMPWKVALELNKVMNTGGIGYLHAPQTTALHDLPWDFWRFSDMAWHSLFNAYTGFEIIKTSYTQPTYVVPFVFNRAWEGYEKAAGFAGSSVLFRKVGGTTLGWDVPTGAATRGVYPE